MSKPLLNGIDLEALTTYAEQVAAVPGDAVSSYGIEAHWRGGVHSEIRTLNQRLGDTLIEKDFRFDVGEPEQLLGDNRYPTPQEYLLGGMAGCMMVGFVAGATSNGIRLDEVKLTITGDLDLRGFLGVDPQAPIGFAELKFNFQVKGSGTQAQYDEIVASVQQYSPNYRTIADAVKVTAVSL